MSTIYGNIVGGSGLAQTYILEDDNGNEIVGVVSDEEVVLDATVNDVREGKTFASDLGVKTGEKEIPAFHTTEGVKFVEIGSEFAIEIPRNSRYDFTKLQAIICPFNTSPDDSVSTEKVSINGKVYDTGSVESLAVVTVDHDNKAIKLGITNNGTIPYVIRYFTYKEEP